MVPSTYPLTDRSSVAHLEKKKAFCYEKKGKPHHIVLRERNHLLVVNNGGVQTLGLLDVDSVDHGVELLLGVLLVVTLAGDANTQTEGNALDAGFPDLLVKLGVDTDVLGALVFEKNGDH